MYDDLINCMHDEMLKRGEVLSDEAAAEYLMLYERDYRVRLPLSGYRAAVDDAADRFVDSMIQNEYDTEQSDDETDKRVGHWEAMRPSNARYRMILHELKTQLA